ncbi:hypothetical protein BT69DRAFT_435042 [Atractiella rhizophila]|nr:hypothetical protein BT69DRAFT_435042 [Atractiella rhizophila]
MAMIQNSITPFTILTYLRFSLGQGVTGWSGKEERESGCRGLEGVGSWLPNNVLDPTASISSGAGDFFYGPIQERVGESCACWLAKWGSDILPIEEQLQDPLSRLNQVRTTRNLHQYLTHPVYARWQCLKRPDLRVWRSGGVPASWIRGIISSDAFFMSNLGADTSTSNMAGGGEFDRYSVAKRVVDLRRKDRQLGVAEDRLAESLASMDMSSSVDGEKSRGIDSVDGTDLLADEDEEREFKALFADGIYYSHLTFLQLEKIGKDMCPITGQPYVDKEVLRKALWMAEEFKAKIPIAPNAFAARFDDGQPEKDGEDELGISKKLVSKESDLGDKDVSKWFMVPVDSTLRLSDFSLPLPPSHPRRHSSSPMSLPPGADRFFSLSTAIRSSLLTTQFEELEGRKATAYEPCRFSVEFWGVSELKEKQRLYSQTFVYAGSLFNAYLQIVRKKQLQLGVRFPSPLYPFLTV